MTHQDDETPKIKRRRGRPRLQANERQDKLGTVQALERGLILLQMLSKRGSASLSDLSAQLELPAPTAYRMLLTLQKHEFVSFDDTTQKWAVGIEAFTVGRSYLNRASLTDSSRAVMQQLMQDTGETANLAMLSAGGQITFLTQIECTHPIRAFHLPGTRSPAHSSGIGKALLAEFPKPHVEDLLFKEGLEQFTHNTITTPELLFDDLDVTFSRGWAFDDEERHVGMRCIASAIHDTRGDAIAGISISGPTARFADEQLSALGHTVKQAAADITRLIGGDAPDVDSRRSLKK